MVYATLETLGRASPREVALHLAPKLGVESEDAAYLRTLYRDLKELADAGQFQIHYFTPDGREVAPDEGDNGKNLRLEYSVSRAHDESVRGWKVLDDMGAMLLPAEKNIGWSVSLPPTIPQNGELRVLFKAHGGAWASLNLALADGPGRVVFARRKNGEATERTKVRAELNEDLGRRATALLVADQSVSRWAFPAQRGHAVLTLGSNFALTLTDQKSKSGTWWSPVDAKTVEEFLRMSEREGTVPLQNDLLLQDETDWRAVNGQVELPSCCRVRVGGFRFVIWMKTP